MFHSKKILSLMLIALSTSSAHATINTNHGIYLGGELGAVGYNEPDNAGLNTVFSHITPIRLRPFIGYRISDYLAIEGGYNNIANAHSNDNGHYWGPDHYKLYSFDLAAKLIQPYSCGYSLFAKVGAALTHEDAFNQVYANNPKSIILDSNSTEIQPLLGVGISYNFTRQIAADLSYSYQFQTGNIRPIEMLGVSASYTFNNLG